jgi:hypothetical protein
MIKKIIFPIVAILILSSCAGKFGVMKRRYNKGYYIAHVNEANSKNSKEATKLASAHTPKKNATQHAPDPKLTLKTDELAANDQPSFKKKQVENLSVLPITRKKEIPVPTKTVSYVSAKKALFGIKSLKAVPDNLTQQKTKESGDDDAKFIVMIILCFLWFFNLIPVYLHDGKKLTWNFLITLILDFTFILGVVFALLVVLDVINLA